ncbi:hypothetical protein VB816_30580, partial [Limnoraphis robusta CCNP1324]|uniref:hypothetical protein n=1 Tax=Limnoraphis robusta TaxID=1118279 RepID=UPI002B20CF69
MWVDTTFPSHGPAPGIDHRLPPQLGKLERRGLEIRRHNDIGPLTKIVPTLKRYPEALVVTADDDMFYPHDWLEELYDAYLREPGIIHAHRAHRMTFDSGRVRPYREWEWEAPGFQGPSFDLFPTGVGGVLYAPGHLHREVMNERAYLQLSPKADDVWLKAMSLLNGVQCKKVNPFSRPIHEVAIPGTPRLGLHNYFEHGNDHQLKA